MKLLEMLSYERWHNELNYVYFLLHLLHLAIACRTTKCCVQVDILLLQPWQVCVPPRRGVTEIWRCKTLRQLTLKVVYWCVYDDSPYDSTLQITSRQFPVRNCIWSYRLSSSRSTWAVEMRCAIIRNYTRFVFKEFDYRSIWTRTSVWLCCKRENMRI